jgi:beta-1,2-mannobiose phosphorylase / 1,2-beta-oligomannan phosphorylase
MIEKYAGNPVVCPEMVKPSLQGYRVMGAFNPGATAYGNEILLLLRVAERVEPRPGRVRMPVYRFDTGRAVPDILDLDAADPEVVLRDTRGVAYRGREYLSTLSHIRIARSTDGLHFAVDPEPFIYPVCEAEAYGIEDARVTFLDGRYYLNYTVVSRDSWATALAVTDDFRTLERKGLIFHPENKDVAVFPEKVGGRYVALHRPNNSGFGRASIWYAQSPDLLHWGQHECIVRPRDNRWEAAKIGGGAPPIKTSRGWLVIYHGKGENSLYSLFTLLLDLEDPRRVLGRGVEPILIPDRPYETHGFFPNVVFSNGVVERDGRVYLYYGAADESACVALTDVDTLLATL